MDERSLHILLLVASYSYALQCYDCQNMNNPAECKVLTSCNDNQSCMVRQYVDDKIDVKYDLSCISDAFCEEVSNVRRSVEMVVWTRCCRHDRCNRHYNSHGDKYNNVYCLQCDKVDHPDDCNRETICGLQELCYTRQFIDYKNNSAYRLGCESLEICKLYKTFEGMFVGLPEASRNGYVYNQEGGPDCFDCCNNTNCNKDLCTKNHKAITTNSSLIKMTTTISQLTTVTTMTLPPTTTTMTTATSQLTTTTSPLTMTLTTTISPLTATLSSTTTTAITPLTTNKYLIDPSTSSASTTRTTSSTSGTTTERSITHESITNLESTLPTTTKPSVVAGCSSGHWKYKDTCYYLNLTKMYWQDAEHACRIQGGELASVTNHELDTFIVQQLSRLNIPGTVEGVWIGAIYINKTFRWMDGSDVTYERLQSNLFPVDQTGFCLYISNPSVHWLSSWLWSSDMCNLYKHVFMCEINVG